METSGLPPLKRGETLVSRIYSRWTVELELESKGYEKFYLCRCECGKTGRVSRNNLLQGISKSCGCLRTEMIVARSTTHGGYHDPEHRVWATMLNRCSNEKYREYRYYGGKGVKVSDEWKLYENFKKDMGDRPTPKHQIDRKDSNLGYSKENCHWVTALDNNRNRSTTVFVEYGDKRITLKELSEITGVPYHALFYRYQAGDRGERLSRPSQAKKDKQNDTTAS